MSSVTRNARRLILATLICVPLSACQHLRFPEQAPPEANPPEAEREEEPVGDWSKLAAQGRAALRSRDLAESERAYLASLEATAGLDAGDIRVATALDNLARLASYYQRVNKPEEATSLVEVLAKNAEEGRKGDFETESVPMVAEANRLSGEEDYEAAIRLYRLSLTLLGADKRANQSAQLSAQWNLMQTLIESEQITEAEAELQAIREEIEERYEKDSPPTLGLLIPTGQIQIANGEIAAGEESYLKVIDSDMASTQQKTTALELYIEALQGQDRNKEAAKFQAQLKALQQGP